MSVDTIIAQIEEWAGTKLPDSYRALLLAHSDQGIVLSQKSLQNSGAILSSDVVFYPVQSVIEMNEEHQTKTHCPGYLAVGVSNKGNLILISLAPGTATVFMSKGNILDPKEFHIIDTSMSDWIDNECKI